MLSALALARKVEAGELTPSAVVDLCAEAIARPESAVEAFAARGLDGALKAARERASRLRAAPLRGLPVGIKDIFDTADLPTQYGSPIYQGHRPKADSALVAVIRRAGGLILGKTVTTEFASLQPSKTRNPVNLAHTPGGSSSGSAAAVAAGMVPVATGSQTGGSIIRPASFCGVAGYKPSFKLMPTVGMKCYSWHLDTAGLLAAGVADVAFAAAAITGRDLRVDRAAPAAPRIAVIRKFPWPEASAAMQDAVEQAAKAASVAGARIDDVTLPPMLAEAFEAHSVVQDFEAFQAMAWEYDNHRDRIGPLIGAALDKAAAITPDAYDAARRTTRRARKALGELMADIDVLLSPSAPGAAPEGLGATGNPMFNRLWTLMGTPCVSVPGLVDQAGLPLGVQAIGRFGGDRGTLEAAAFVEAAIAKAIR